MESPGFGSGMVRPPLHSTPNSGRGWSSPRARVGGRGRGRGGPETAQRGDAGGSGTATEVLAKNLKLLLKEYKYQEKKKSKLRRISLVSALTGSKSTLRLS